MVSKYQDPPVALGASAVIERTLPERGTERCCQYLRFLRAGHHRYALYKERGHPVDAVCARFALFIEHLTLSQFRPQQLINRCGTQPAFCRDFPEHLAIPDVLAVDEIGQEEILDDRVLISVAACKPAQTVSVAGVGNALDSVQAKLDSVLRPSLDHASFQFLCIGGAAELPGPVRLPVHALFG